MWENNYEEKILDYWEKDNTFFKLRQKNKGKKAAAFY